MFYQFCIFIKYSYIISYILFTALLLYLGIQFAVYELMKRSLVGLPPPKQEKELKEKDAILKVKY